MFTIVIVALLVVEVGSVFSGEKKETDFDSFEHGTKPEGEALDLGELPDPDDEEEVIEFVANLYKIACENYQKTEDVAYMVNASTLMLNMINVPSYRFCVKNGETQSYLEFSFIDGGSDNPLISLISAIMGATAADSTQYALATYTDSTMDYSVKRNVVLGETAEYINYTANEDGTVTFDIDWSTPEVSENGKPVFCASQEEKYQNTDHTITVETIKSATITYNEEEGYYRCVMELDPDLAPAERTLPKLKAGAGDTAHYTQLTQIMEVWDNGHFKYFNAIDKWEANSGAVTSTIDFKTTYYYDEEHTNVENYQYMVEMCHK